MLQWMGGSRRKVTASRKSTQKRQRQYFEQRKRQQQQQQATGLETFSDGGNISQHLDTNRSLDILSLLNLSTVVQYRKSSCHSSRENSGGNAMTGNYHITTCQPTIQADKVTPADPVEFEEARNPPVSQVETVYPKKFHRVLSSTPATENRHLNGHGDRTDQLKMTSDRQLSVFDLLGDDGPNESLQETPKHEAHVAFAIEGLGKVETETPVHSPQQPGRMFSYGSSLPLEVARQRQSSKNFDDLLYDLELDVGAMSQDLHSGSYLDDPFCSRGTVNLHSKQGQKVSTGKAYSRFNINASSLKNFADDKMSYNIADEDNDIWKDGNFLDEDCDITWNGSLLEIDGSSSEFWNLGSHEMSDFALGGPHFEKMVTEKARGRFNISGSF